MRGMALTSFNALDGGITISAVPVAISTGTFICRRRFPTPMPRHHGYTHSMEFRCESLWSLRLRSAMVQSLACFARGQPVLFRALSLALAQTSSRVSHYASRYQHAADRIPYRQNLGNRRDHHAFQRRTANKSAPDR